MVALDFRNVLLNADVNEDEFNYVPPTRVPQQDVTNIYKQRLVAPQTQTTQPPQQSDAPTTQPADENSKQP